MLSFGYTQLDPKKIKLLTKNFITEVKALPGGIEWNIGDQMVGKETLPIVLGEKKSFRLLYILILGFILTSIWLICAYNLPFILLTNAIILISFLIYLWQVEHKHLRPGVLSDALVDGGLILMGLLSLL